jgi:hypothetical protein
MTYFGGHPHLQTGWSRVAAMANRGVADRSVARSLVLDGVGKREVADQTISRFGAVCRPPFRLGRKIRPLSGRDFTAYAGASLAQALSRPGYKPDSLELQVGRVVRLGAGQWLP